MAMTNLEDVGLSAASNSRSRSKARECGYMSRPQNAAIVRSGEAVKKLILEPPFDFLRNIIPPKITGYTVAKHVTRLQKQPITRDITIIVIARFTTINPRPRAI